MREEAEAGALGVDAQLPGGRNEQSGHKPQQRCLAGSIRPRHEQEAAALQIEVESLEHALGAEALREAAGENQKAASPSTNAKKTTLMIPFIVKNAAFKRRRSRGETSACSNASSKATAATPSQ